MNAHMAGPVFTTLDQYDISQAQGNMGDGTFDQVLLPLGAAWQFYPLMSSAHQKQFCDSWFL